MEMRPGPHFDTNSRNPNRLRVCEFASTGGAELATETGTFYAAKWQAGIGCYHCVDENHSGVQIRGEQASLFGIVGPRAGGETECGVVCHSYRIGCIADVENRCDRAEYFFAVRRRIFRNFDEHSWLVEKSRTVNAISAG